MPDYRLPDVTTPAPVPPRTAVLVASGDSRPAANATCWPAQAAVEADAADAFASLGWRLERAHGVVDGPAGPHGFIDSQRRGVEVFAGIDPDAPLVVAEAVWQYSHHVLAGLLRHRGPVLVLANWSGTWPGLVGALNLRGSLAKAGRACSLLWAESFADPAFRGQLRAWCESGTVEHDASHVRPLETARLPAAERALGEAVAADLKARPAILGVFDEGCMGMFNAIVPDDLLHATGVFKERLSQSALYHEMTRVSDADARAAFDWYRSRGMSFDLGPDEAADLTEAQVLGQCRMYVAAARMADAFGCDAVGIQYQQGLKDLAPASDLAEGTLNCSDRPPVARADGSTIRGGEPIVHFNEVDECAGLDGLVTHRVWRSMGLQPDNTLHDLRWGDADRSGTTGEFVWVFEISGSVPPTHLAGGWAGATGERQPSMYFRLGGSTIKGVSRPGECVWSRVFVEGGRLHADLGRCAAVELPPEETQRRWDATTGQWPIMHAVTYGVSRDQMMGRHRANHIQIAYGDAGEGTGDRGPRDAEAADRALAAKAAALDAMGVAVHLCGSDRDGTPLGERLVSLA